MIGRVLLALCAWEGLWWLRRRTLRTSRFADAEACARTLGRPLVVVGAPDAGPTGGYGCGDVTIDLARSACPGYRRADVTERLPFENDSVVVLVSCVLEYVEDLDAALAELRRVSGGWLYVVRVEPWTLTAHLYPGARRTLSQDLERPAWPRPLLLAAAAGATP